MAKDQEETWEDINEEVNRKESELSTKEFQEYLLKQSREEVRKGMERRAKEKKEKSSEQGSQKTKKDEDLVAKLVNLLSANFDEVTMRPIYNPRIAEKVWCYVSQSSPEGSAVRRGSWRRVHQRAACGCQRKLMRPERHRLPGSPTWCWSTQF